MVVGGSGGVRQREEVERQVRARPAAETEAAGVAQLRTPSSAASTTTPPTRLCVVKVLCVGVLVGGLAARRAVHLLTHLRKVGAGMAVQ